MQAVARVLAKKAQMKIVFITRRRKIGEAALLRSRR
jgi:hypothetical protein